VNAATEALGGGCQCGRTRYAAQGVPRNLCFCHCASCRRASGAPLVAWGSFGFDAFQLLPGGAYAVHRSSPPVERGFCAACGTALTYRHLERAAEIDVTLATLDEPGRFEPECHIWVEDRLPWLRIADGRPQFARWRD
jgi:hypothetical protein